MRVTTAKFYEIEKKKMLLKNSVSFITYSSPPHLYSDKIQGIQLLRNSKCHNKRRCIFLLHFSHHLYTLLLLSSPSSPSLAPRRSFRNHTILNKPICRMNNPHVPTICL